MENLDLDTQPTSVCVALAYGLGNYASTGPRRGTHLPSGPMTMSRLRAIDIQRGEHVDKGEP